MKPIIRYFLNLLKQHDSTGILVYKTLLVSEHGHRMWVPEDSCPNAKKAVIVGLNNGLYNKDFLNFSSNDASLDRSSTFDFNWVFWTSALFKLSDLEKCNYSSSDVYSMLENIFLQILNMSDQGMNVFLGQTLFIKKNSTYEHLAKIDMLDAIE